MALIYFNIYNNYYVSHSLLNSNLKTLPFIINKKITYLFHLSNYICTWYVILHNIMF